MERFSISIEKELLKSFDQRMEKGGYSNRSEAIRDLIRKDLISEEWRADEDVVGVITLVYDHHTRQLQNKITDIQHEYHHQVISTNHVHLDHDNCLEVVIVKGRAGHIRAMAQKLIAIRGVKTGDLTASSTGSRL